MLPRNLKALTHSLVMTIVHALSSYDDEEKRVEKRRQGTSDEIKDTTGRHPNNKGNSKIYQKNRPVQARPKIIQESCE